MHLFCLLVSALKKQHHDQQRLFQSSMYVCVCAYVFMYLYVCASVCAFVHACECVYVMCVFLCVCAHVCFPEPRVLSREEQPPAFSVQMLL